MSKDVIYAIDGCIVKVKDTTSFSMLEKVFVGKSRLMGEVIAMNRKETLIQVYESTSGLQVGEEVISKTITRTTPILIQASGYSRFTHKEYIIEEQKKISSMKSIVPNIDSFYEDENFAVNEAERILKLYFNTYKDDMYN